MLSIPVPFRRRNVVQHRRRLQGRIWAPRSADLEVVLIHSPAQLAKPADGLGSLCRQGKASRARSAEKLPVADQAFHQLLGTRWADAGASGNLAVAWASLPPLDVGTHEVQDEQLAARHRRLQPGLICPVRIHRHHPPLTGKCPGWAEYHKSA